LSGRNVLAFRAELRVTNSLIVRFQQHPDLRERIRKALRASFDDANRVLQDITVSLDAATVASSGHLESLEAHPYRDTADRHPSPAVLRSAAERFATLSGEETCAALLSRATFRCEPAAPLSRDQRACYRVHVLLSLDDLALAAQAPELRRSLSNAVRTVGTTPETSIGDVTLAPMLEGVADTAAATGPSRQATALIQDLLAGEGVVTVVVASIPDGTRLVAHYRGRTAILDLVHGSALQPAQAIERMEVGVDGPDPAGVARRIRAMLEEGSRTQ